MDANFPANEPFPRVIAHLNPVFATTLRVAE
jgi:hypothetical protein